MKYILTICCLVASTQINAQSALTGQVFSEQNEPIIGAVISLRLMTDTTKITAVLSDDEGHFTFEKLSPDNYSLSARCVGSLLWQKDNIQIKQAKNQHLRIVMQPAEMMLSGVEIKAGRQLVGDDTDGKYFLVSKSLNTVGATAEDILSEVPTLATDVNANVLMRGNQNVQVLVNGRQSGLLGTSRQAALRYIPASAIERIEVKTSPDASSDANGMAGIINIVLKKGKQYGWNGTATANLSPDQRLDGSTTLSFGSTWGSVFATASARTNLFDGAFNTDRTYASKADTTYYYAAYQDFTRTQRNYNFNTGFQSEVRRGHQFSIELTGNNSANSGEDQLAWRWLTEQKTYSSGGVKFISSTGKNINADMHVNYQYQWGKQAENSVQIQGQQSWAMREFHLLTREEFYAKDSIWRGSGRTLLYREPTDTELGNTLLKANATQTIRKNMVLKYGFQYTKNQFISRIAPDDLDFDKLVWVADTGRTATFNYQENIVAVFGQLEGKLHQNISYQVGTRGEVADIFTSLTNENFKKSPSYSKLYPTVAGTWQFRPKNTVELKYNYRVNRPDFTFLTPFFSYNSPTSISVGNPSLRPEFAHSLEVGYLYKSPKFSIHPSIFARHLTDAIGKILLPDSLHRVIYSFANISTAKNYGLDITTSYQYKTNTRFNYSIGYYRTIFANDTISASLSQPGKVWQWRLSWLQNFSDNLLLQTTAYYASRWSWAEGNPRPVYYIDAALKYSVPNSGWAAVLRINDVFSTRRYQSTYLASVSTNIITQQRDT